MQENWISINGEPTCVCSVGFVKEASLVGVLITGNPGVPYYYSKFIQQLYYLSNFKFPICCVNLAGHVSVPEYVEVEGSPSKNYLDLKGQVQHKLDFIKQYLKPESKLILMGHSIGAKICLDMAKELPDERILKIVFLAPTIERMKASPNGKRFWPLLNYGRLFAPIVLFPLYCFSESMRKRMVALNFWFTGGVEDQAIPATAKFLTPYCVGNSLQLAYEELSTIFEADHKLLEEYLNKIFFFYSSVDKWCPLEYAEEMQKIHPTADVYIDKSGIEHAFVLKSSKETANIVWNNIKDEI